MPYINPMSYARAAHKPDMPGELNYAITMRIIALMEAMYPLAGSSFQEFGEEVWIVCQDYLDRMGLSYTNGNAVMGVLDCADREMYRRVDLANSNYWRLHGVTMQLQAVRRRVYDELLVPYEDQKIVDNGDVYPRHLTES